jgi:primosomal protein N' (replication factor Y)
VQRTGVTDWLGAVFGPVLAADRSGMVVVATATEARWLAEAAAVFAGNRVVTVLPEDPAAQVTSAWVRVATEPGLLLVGTPRVMLWPLARSGLLASVEEGRRAMKERQTPTLHVREVLRNRSVVGRSGLVFSGPTPSLELLAAGAEILRTPGRVWPLVEVVDRSSEPGLFTPAVKMAIRAAVSNRARVFVFTHRRGYAPASRCVRCRSLRRCPDCGSRPDPGRSCTRCGALLGPCPACGGGRFEPLGAGVGRATEELRRFTGPVVEAPGTGPVVVGSEADLASLPPQDLVVVTDADGLIYGTSFRAAEDALRVLARLAGKLAPARGRRMMVQTVDPGHPVVAALRRGDPTGFLQAELENRSRLGFPPSTDLVVVELRSARPPRVDEDLHQAAAGSTVLGPVEAREGTRWLIQGDDLSVFRRNLRPLVQRWRDTGATVRIDVDPIDL